ncbi:MAG: PIG-L deacetylase family protein [Syntrophales bacterium]|nr:PIG-L deacetylase family protein [Syntrophales bacterium]
MLIQRCLVIAAHPDDEVLGCGGTMNRFVSEGVDVCCLILGEGVTSRDEQRNVELRRNEIDVLKETARQANKLLGVNEVFFGSLPDNRFDCMDLLDIIKVVEKYVDMLQPEWVFTHNCDDLNNDHRKTFQAVQTACRPVPGHSVTGFFSFPVPSSTEWNFEKVFCPNLFVDISSSLEKKMQAAEIYSTEMREWPHPRSLKAIEDHARQFGVCVGKSAVEPFKIIRMGL